MSTIRSNGVRSALIGALLLLATATGCAAEPDPPAAADHSDHSVAADHSTAGSSEVITDASEAAGAATLLDPQEFADAMARPGVVVINVHVPFEGKLGEGDLMIPYDQIPQHLDQLPADRSTPLAIYCRSGSMSATAAPILAGLGFTDIVDLRGGMQAWVADGRSLITTQ